MNIKSITDGAKKHAFELSCGGVAVLALVIGYWGVPFLWGGIPAVTEKLSTDSLTRLKDKQSVVSVLATDPNLEGVRTPSGFNPKEITYTESLSKVREDSNKLMKGVNVQVLEAAANGNRHGRMQMIKGAYTKTPFFMDEDDTRKLTLQGNSSYLHSKGTLPASNTFPFVDIYRAAFGKLTNQLTGTTDSNAGVAPEYAALDKAYNEERERQKLATPVALRPRAGMGVPKVDEAARDKFIRDHVMAVANRTAMYVDPKPNTSFQQRTMGGGAVAPLPSEIWEGYIDIWLQRDVVEAIVATNKESTRTGAGVAKSLVPRLIQMTVGTAAKAPFQTNGTVGAPPQLPPGTVAGTLFENVTGSLDPAFSMTGRQGNDQYYVVQMSVTVVCDPVAINKFINNLYKQNNGYTVLVRRDTTVDPYEAAGTGFLYGDRACVKVELLVECLMFKNWVDEVQPQP